MKPNVKVQQEHKLFHMLLQDIPHLIVKGAVLSPSMSNILSAFLYRWDQIDHVQSSKHYIEFHLLTSSASTQLNVTSNKIHWAYEPKQGILLSILQLFGYLT